MANDLTAALILKLTDQLSGPIDAIMKRLDRLRAITDKIKLGGLETADAVLDRARDAADRLVGKLDGIPGAARRGTDALRRMAEQAIRVNAAGVAVTPAQAAMAARAITLALPLAIAAAGTGGGFRLPPPPSYQPDAPFMEPLRLGGPAGGMGIPLAPLRTASIQWANLRQQAAGFRAELGRSVGLMREFGHGTRSLAEGAVGAAATGFGLFEPIKMYAEQENTLRHMAITANKTGPDVEAMVARLGPKYQAMALQMGQRSRDVIEAASFLSTTGIGQEMVDRLVPTIARASTAYNTPVKDATQLAFTLNEVLKVHAPDMERVLSMGALAGKSSHFAFADMSRFLPEIASSASMRGITGPEGAASLFAMLATSRRHAGTSGQAATNVQDFLAQLDQRQVRRGFARHGVDLSKVLLDAETKGINPGEAVLAKIKQLTHGMTPAAMSGVVNDLFHNQQARTLVQAMLQDTDFYIELKKKLLNSGPDQIRQDWGDAMRAPLVKLNRIQELLSQSVIRFGRGFVGELGPLDRVLSSVLGGLESMDAHAPGMLDNILGWVGGFLALTAAFGLLKPVLGLVATGAKLVFTPFKWIFSVTAWLARGLSALLVAMGPVGWALLGLGAIALAVWYNWDWLQKHLDAFGSWLGSWAESSVHSVEDAWGRLRGFFDGLASDIQKSFDRIKGPQAAIEQTQKGIAAPWNRFEVPDGRPLDPDEPGFDPEMDGKYKMPRTNLNREGYRHFKADDDEFKQYAKDHAAHMGGGQPAPELPPVKFEGSLNVSVDVSGMQPRVTATDGKTNLPGVTMTSSLGRMVDRP